MKKIILTSALALLGFAAFAQKGNIGFVYPAGAQKGTTVELTVGGQNLSKAQGIIISGEGVSGELIPAPKGVKPKKRKKKNIGEEDNLQLADQVKFRVTVAPDAVPGLRDLRLVMPGGMTNRLYFEIGELPDVYEDPKAELSAVSESLPVTFNGQVMRSDVDRFRFSARKNQQLVISVKARILVPYMADAVPGWFQPIIRLYGPDGKEVGYNDDYSFHVDPVLFYKVPASGDYEVEINDALYRGREDFAYRIDVGQLPFITGISPLGGPVGQKTTVHLRGYNLRRTKLDLKPEREGRIAVRGSSKKGLSSNAVLFDATAKKELPSVCRGGVGTTRESALHLSIGECAQGVFRSPMEQHWYNFDVTGKAQIVNIKVVSRALGAPTDARITLYDRSGKAAKDVDDFETDDDCLTTHFADPQMTLTLRGGHYLLRVIESQGHSGEDYGYRLYLDKSMPDFSLHLDPATFTVPRGGTGIFTVIATRKQNFTGEIKIDVTNLPEGYKVCGNTIQRGQKKTFVSISAPAGAVNEALHPKVRGIATSRNGQEIVRDATPVETMMQAFYYTHLMPMDEFRMEIGDEQPFRIEQLAETIELDRSEEGTPLKVRIARKPGFNAPVTLMLKVPVGTIKAEALVIPEGENEGTLHIKVKPGRSKAKINRSYPLVVYGVVKGSSKKIAGKGRNAYVAAVTSYAPTFYGIIPRDK